MAELPSAGNLSRLPGRSLPVIASGSFRSALSADHQPYSTDLIQCRCYSDICLRSFDFPSPPPPVGAFHLDSTAPDQSRCPSGSWSFRSVEPEMKRKRRVAAYKVICLEGKVRSSVRKSFRWLKDKYLGMVKNGTDM